MIPRIPSTSGFAARMAFARQSDPADDVRRATASKRIKRITVTWLVAVPVLLVCGLLGRPHTGGVLSLAALLALVLPFAGAVIATRHQRFGIAASYLVVSLLMIVPSLAIARAG